LCTEAVVGEREIGREGQNLGCGTVGEGRGPIEELLAALGWEREETCWERPGQGKSCHTRP
jgi:hypothetical protein